MSAAKRSSSASATPRDLDVLEEIRDTLRLLVMLSVLPASGLDPATQRLVHRRVLDDVLPPASPLLQDDDG